MIQTLTLTLIQLNYIYIYLDFEFHEFITIHKIFCKSKK